MKLIPNWFLVLVVQAFSWVFIKALNELSNRAKPKHKEPRKCPLCGGEAAMEGELSWTCERCGRNQLFEITEIPTWKSSK